MALTLTVKEAEISPPIPENIYEAEVQEIEEDSGNFGDFVRITFNIVTGEYKGTTRNLIASKKLSRSGSGKTSKLYDIVKALTKDEPKPGAEVDLEGLKSKRCKILVKNGKEQDGVTYQNITEVMPA